MPEGDTILRTARALHRALVGKPISAARASDPSIEAALRARIGVALTSVEARGKHLLIHFPDEHVLHSHMQMTGSWHLYRPGERWRVDPRAARVVLTFVDVVAVCFSAPHVRWLSPAALAHDRWLGELGEDLLDPKFALDRAVGDLRAGDDLSIGEAVMDQRRIAGVGNIYKSESLFLATLSPFAKVSALDDASLRALITTAQRLLLASVEGRRGNALLDRAGARFWAYRRAREPCLVCGAAIVMKRQGMAQRSTYWCPGCQPTPRGGA